MIYADEASQQFESRRLIWRTSLILIPVFWALQFGLLTAWRAIEFPDQGLDIILRRLLVTLIGMTISAAVVAAHLRLLGRSFSARVGFAAVAALAGGALHATANYLIFYVWLPPDDTVEANFAMIYFSHIMQWLWVYIALSSILLALTYSADLRERDRRMSELRAIAHAAQLRALRYQLNPHFLFNTLNSIAALIAQQRNDVAEEMVENLSDFLRTGLALDPHDDIPLDQEIALQSLYLGIEELRFPERLRVAIDLPDALRKALVPSLILQPLVENAVKYAVAKSTTPVTVRIAAEREDEWLHLSVSDSGGDAPKGHAHGTGVGLANVAARLRARFAQDGQFEAGPRPDGFSARLSMPLALAG